MIREAWTGIPQFLDFDGHPPGVQAVLLGLATFVQEDVPTLTAALLAGAGRLPWFWAWLGCGLGIWIGDALLYLMGRGLGRKALLSSWARRWVSEESIEASESWFARRGSWMLVASRFMPGMRLPTYLAAGFLKLPFGRFLWVTGIVVVVWTVLIFVIAHHAGGRMQTAPPWGASGSVWIYLAMGVMGAWCLGWLRKLPGYWRRWEFWPAWLFYLPVIVNALRLSVKYGGFTLPTASNPGIETGGMVGESKFAVLRQLQVLFPEATAESWLLESGDGSCRPAALKRILEAHGVEYPFILKPDVGQRGLGVKRVHDWVEAEAYLSRTRVPLVVQRYIPGPYEAGVFYYRFPHETKGRVMAITEKVFPAVVGDGRRTLEELVRQDSRARWMADRYLKRLGPRRHQVPEPGESVSLVATGNHAQGCVFRDGSRWLTPELEARIDAISRQLPGFCIGRFDVRFESESSFREGHGFQILELNGASAEATHIYDARHSIGFAYATLFRQWDLVYAIGSAQRALGVSTTSVWELCRRWFQARQAARTLPLAD